ncbi:MAG: hypothetical protein ACP5GH_06635 [Nitrososphaeria archaeon]
MRLKGASGVVAELLLISIVIIASMAVYGLVIQRGNEVQRGASIQITSAGAQYLGSGLVLLSVRVLNAGGVPEVAGAGVSGLSGCLLQASGSGYLFYTAASLQKGTYYLPPGSFILGPDANGTWREVSGDVNLMAGTYQIAVRSSSPEITTNVSSTWLIARYEVLRGGTLTPSEGSPLSLAGAVVVGACTFQGDSPAFSLEDLSPGVPLGLLMPGQSAALSVLICGNYSPGMSLTVTVQAWTLGGSSEAQALSVQIYP